VHHLRWPDAGSLQAELRARVRQAAPVLRWAGGALIADLSLFDNLMLEPALADPAARADAPAAQAGVLRADQLGDLQAELRALWAAAGCPADSRTWPHTLPGQADARALLQVRVGRAWMADPDVLVLDADHWDDAVLPREHFSRSFAARHPWRVLVWAGVAEAGKPS
jgi:hypothetical protein